MKFFNKIPFYFKYVFFIFISSRLALTIIGVSSRILMQQYKPKQTEWIFTKPLWLDIWGVWDSIWYIRIAKNGYDLGSWGGISQFAFFPLYPFLIKLFSFFTHHYFMPGVLISNIFLLISGVFLYKLVTLENDKETAFRSVLYMFLFPTAFIFSGVFTESLFLALALICFYYAKLGHWGVVGISGFFLALTRLLGVLIVIPLAIEFFKQKSPKHFFHKEFLWLLCIPLGFILFGIYNYLATGDFFSFTHVQSSWGSASLSNPLRVLTEGFKDYFFETKFSAVFTAFFLLILICFYKKVDPTYWLFGMYSILFPLSFRLQSMPRYMMIVFPIYIIFAKLTKNHYIHEMFIIGLALFQGFLMALWVNAFALIV